MASGDKPPAAQRSPMMEAFCNARGPGWGRGAIGRYPSFKLVKTSHVGNLKPTLLPGLPKSTTPQNELIQPPSQSLAIHGDVLKDRLAQKMRRVEEEQQCVLLRNAMFAQTQDGGLAHYSLVAVRTNAAQASPASASSGPRLPASPAASDAGSASAFSRASTDDAASSLDALLGVTQLEHVPLGHLGARG
jgi:hypothetical protein